MLLSMTGHGEAHCQQATTAIVVEVRSLNSRYFKLTVRSTEGYSSLEPRMEAVVRNYIRRGTVQVNLRVERHASQDDFRINDQVLLAYRTQLEELAERFGEAADSSSQRPLVSLESLLQLPGVVEERFQVEGYADADWPLIEPVLIEALEGLSAMRRDEGSAMAQDLTENCILISKQLETIAERAPLVVEDYARRLADRLNKLLSERQVEVDESSIIREVGIFADRSDVSEEIVRLRSHLEQFGSVIADETSNGRKLDFITQEMFRETNTIGSKANDALIARSVIDIKTAIERMREMIQNVE